MLFQLSAATPTVVRPLQVGMVVIKAVTEQVNIVKRLVDHRQFNPGEDFHPQFGAGSERRAWSAR